MNQDRNFPPTVSARSSSLAWRLLYSLLAAFLLLSLTSFAAVAQDDEESEEPEIPEPEPVTLQTDDNVVLKCTYYPGTEGKDTVPVVLLHGWEGNRLEFEDLALYLQSLGHAVFVPDLRGHGDSTVRRVAGGQDQTIDINRMNRRDFGFMVTQDMQAVKKYLTDRNNEGELNIDMLTVVGSEMGAVVAINWCALDWSWPQLPAVRQGQDVKAFVLISAPQSFRGLNVRQALQHPQVGGELSALLVVGGDDARTASETQRLYNSLLRLHGPLPEPEDRVEMQDLYHVPLETSLQGTELLNARGLDVPGLIGDFIERRLVNKADEFPWNDRSGR